MKLFDYGKLTNLTELEAKANRYTVKCQRNSFLILTVVWLLNVFDIFIIDDMLMNTAYIVSFCITLGCFAVCRLGGAGKPWVKYVLLFFTVLFSTTIATYLTYQAILVAAIPLCYSMHYYKRKVVYYTYALTVVGMFYSTMAGYFIGLCDANMLVLTNGAMAKYVQAGSNTALFDAVNSNPWGTLPLYYALPRCMILFAIMIIGSHAVGSSLKRTLEEIELRRRSELDGMTGLFNKNKYIEMSEQHYPGIDTIGVLFWDADGLKTLNDKFGHEVGDSLLVAVGMSIQELCNETRHGYRIGGDEFLMILEHADEAEMLRVVEEWKKKLVEINRNAEVRFEASVGYAIGSGKDLEAVVRRADERMYEHKRSRTKTE